MRAKGNSSHWRAQLKMGPFLAKDKKTLNKFDKKIKTVDEFNGKLSDKGFAVDDVAERRQLLFKKRKHYLADAKKAELWMKEKLPIAQISNCGKDERSSCALLKNHESFINELKVFGSTVKALKIQASNINQLESEISLECSQQNLATEEISSTLMQVQIEAEYNDLLNLAKKRRKKLNESTKTYILLREANEHANSIEDTIHLPEMEFQKISTALDQSEFMEKYNNFQTNVRTTEAHFFFMDQIITELSKLGKKEDALKIQVQLQALNEKWTQTFKKLETAYEKHRFRRDVDEINASIREKLNTMKEMIIIGRDLKTVQALQEKQEAFEGDLNIVTEKVQLINKRQEHFMQTNSKVAVETYSKLEEINREWTTLIEGMTIWKQKLNTCYEIYKSLLHCEELMERFGTRLPRLEADDINADNNNNDMF